jgi:hypothetical protein
MLDEHAMACEVVWSVDSEVGQNNRDHRLAKYNHPGIGLSSPSATHYIRLDYFFLATQSRRHSARFLLSRDPIVPDDVRWLGLDPLFGLAPSALQ